MAGSLGMSERECAFHCLKGLAKFVVVDEQKNVIPIANQDFAGIRCDSRARCGSQACSPIQGILVSRIEPPLVHAHIGHVMTAWRERREQVGLLTIALSDTRIAAAHALLLAKSSSLDDMKLHAGHVLHALDPARETAGPASGYGAKKAAAGAVQHVGFAAAVDNASAAVKSHASTVNATLTDAMAAIDRGIAAAQKIRAAGSAAEAASTVRELQAIIEDITRGLQQSEQEMRLMMKAEGL